VTVPMLTQKCIGYRYALLFTVPTQNDGIASVYLCEYNLKLTLCRKKAQWHIYSIDNLLFNFIVWSNLVECWLLVYYLYLYYGMRDLSPFTTHHTLISEYNYMFSDYVDFTIISQTTYSQQQSFNNRHYTWE